IILNAAKPSPASFVNPSISALRRRWPAVLRLGALWRASTKSRRRFSTRPTSAAAARSGASTVKPYGAARWAGAPRGFHAIGAPALSWLIRWQKPHKHAVTHHATTYKSVGSQSSVRAVTPSPLEIKFILSTRFFPAPADDQQRAILAVPQTR